MKRKPKKQAAVEVTVEPYPIKSKDFQGDPLSRKALSEVLLKNPAWLRAYSILVNERPSKSFLDPANSPTTAAHLFHFSQGYEFCLQKMVDLDKEPPKDDTNIEPTFTEPAIA